MAENEDFTNFFELLLGRLNNLRDKAAKLISRTADFRRISYGWYIRESGGFSNPALMKYVRKFRKEDIMPTDCEIAVEEGYTGFTFEERVSISLEEHMRRNPNYIYGSFIPQLKVIPITPKEANETLRKYKKTGELEKDYSPSAAEFFHDWTYDQRNKESYWINPNEMQEGKEKEFIIQFRNLNQDVVQEVEVKFPEAKKAFENLIERVIVGRKGGERMIH